MPTKSRSKTRTRRRIAVVTGTRAEFGLLETVLREIDRSHTLELQLIVTGMHLLPKFGRSIDHIRKAGWPIAATVKMQTGRDCTNDEPQAVSRGIAGIAHALDRLSSDVVIVLGDRIEAFAAATAAAVGRRVLAHIHGGDRAVGDVDESLRNAITRLAHVHFVATKDAAARLKRMGEMTGRIHRVGAPGLDDIRLFRKSLSANRREVRERLRNLIGPAANAPYALVVQHPCGHGARREAEIVQHIVAAVKKIGLAGIAIYPNSDPGHDGIVQVIRKLKTPKWQTFRTLMRDDYLFTAGRAAVIVGNSSSGIIESASLGIPAVNIGPRQQGRVRCGTSVIDVGESSTAIAAGIRRALRQPRPTLRRSVYGDGRAGERITRTLERLIITPTPIKKRLQY